MLSSPPALSRSGGLAITPSANTTPRLRARQGGIGAATDDTAAVDAQHCQRFYNSLHSSSQTSQSQSQSQQHSLSRSTGHSTTRRERKQHNQQQQEQQHNSSGILNVLEAADILQRGMDLHVRHTLAYTNRQHLKPQHATTTQHHGGGASPFGISSSLSQQQQNQAVAQTTSENENHTNRSHHNKDAHRHQIGLSDDKEEENTVAQRNGELNKVNTIVDEQQHHSEVYHRDGHNGDVVTESADTPPGPVVDVYEFLQQFSDTDERDRVMQFLLRTGLENVSQNYTQNNGYISGHSSPYSQTRQAPPPPPPLPLSFPSSTPPRPTSSSTEGTSAAYTTGNKNEQHINDSKYSSVDRDRVTRKPTSASQNQNHGKNGTSKSNGINSSSRTTAQRSSERKHPQKNKSESERTKGINHQYRNQDGDNSAATRSRPWVRSAVATEELQNNTTRGGTAFFARLPASSATPQCDGAPPLSTTKIDDGARTAHTTKKRASSTHKTISSATETGEATVKKFGGREIVRSLSFDTASSEHRRRRRSTKKKGQHEERRSRSSYDREVFDRNRKITTRNFGFGGVTGGNLTQAPPAAFEVGPSLELQLFLAEQRALKQKLRRERAQEGNDAADEAAAAENEDPVPTSSAKNRTQQQQQLSETRSQNGQSNDISGGKVQDERREEAGGCEINTTDIDPATHHRTATKEKVEKEEPVPRKRAGGGPRSPPQQQQHNADIGIEVHVSAKRRFYNNNATEERRPLVAALLDDSDVVVPSTATAAPLPTAVEQQTQTQTQIELTAEQQKSPCVDRIRSKVETNETVMTTEGKVVTGSSSTARSEAVVTGGQSHSSDGSAAADVTTHATDLNTSEVDYSVVAPAENEGRYRFDIETGEIICIDHHQNHHHHQCAQSERTQPLQESSSNHNSNKNNAPTAETTVLFDKQDDEHDDCTGGERETPQAASDDSNSNNNKNIRVVSPIRVHQDETNFITTTLSSSNLAQSTTVDSDSGRSCQGDGDHKGDSTNKNAAITEESIPTSRASEATAVVSADVDVPAATTTDGTTNGNTTTTTAAAATATTGISSDGSRFPSEVFVKQLHSVIRATRGARLSLAELAQHFGGNSEQNKEDGGPEEECLLAALLNPQFPALYRTMLVTFHMEADV